MNTTIQTKLCKCGKQELHPVRIKYGYDTCVSCSTAEKYGCVDIIHHKTGNNIQILSREDAKTLKAVMFLMIQEHVRSIPNDQELGARIRKIILKFNEDN